MGRLVKQFNGTKVLLHYGGSIKKNGAYDGVVKSLTDAGIPFVELSAKEDDIPDMIKHLSLRGGVGGFVRLGDEDAEAIFRLAL